MAAVAVIHPPPSDGDAEALAVQKEQETDESAGVPEFPLERGMAWLHWGQSKLRDIVGLAVVTGVEFVNLRVDSSL
jgi:hypothetical protein